MHFHKWKRIAGGTGWSLHIQWRVYLIYTTLTGNLGKEGETYSASLSSPVYLIFGWYVYENGQKVWSTDQFQ
jgi:hypothetical protein